MNLEQLVPLSIDDLTVNERFYFMLGYEFNSVVVTMLDRSVSKSICPINIENMARVENIAAKCDRKVTITPTDTYGVMNVLIENMPQFVKGITCPKCGEKENICIVDPPDQIIMRYLCRACEHKFEHWIS